MYNSKYTLSKMQYCCSATVFENLEKLHLISENSFSWVFLETFLPVNFLFHKI